MVILFAREPLAR